MRQKVAAIFLLFACCTGSSLAQGGPGLFAKIDKVFKEKEPAWEVERVNKGDAADPVRRSVTFRSEAGRANVDVSIWAKEKDAREVFAADALAIGNTRGKRMVKAAVPKLGDESNLWTNPGSTAWPLLTFRKGRVNVTVFAPSVDVAKRFAQHVLEQLPAS
jgi:hypothetical protein